MKIKEEFIDGEGDTFVVKQTFDPNPVLESVAQLRSAGLQDMGDSKHVARIPGWMITEWLKEAGVKYSDPAAQDVIKRNIMSGNFSKLRNWQGSY